MSNTETRSSIYVNTEPLHQTRETISMVCPSTPDQTFLLLYFQSKKNKQYFIFYFQHHNIIYINFLSKKLYWLSFIFPMNTLRGNPYKFIFKNLYEEKIVLNPFLPQCRSLLLVLIHFFFKFTIF